MSNNIAKSITIICMLKLLAIFGKNLVIMIKMCSEMVILPDSSITKISFSLFPDDTAEEGGEGETEESISYTITEEVNFTSSKMNRCATT